MDATSPNPVGQATAPDLAREPQARVTLSVGRTLGLLLTILAAAAVAVLVWEVIGRFSHLLLTMLLAVLLAFIFAPAVAALEHRGLPRVAAITLAYLGSLIVLVVVLTVFLGPLVAQLAALAGQLPHQIQMLQGRTSGLDSFFASHGVPLRVATVQKQVLGQTQTIGAVLLGSTLTILGGLTGFVVDLFLILVLSFYFLLDSAMIHNNLIRLLPSGARAQAFFVEAAFVTVVGGYIRGQLLMALTIGAAAGLGCWVLGVPYPLVIGLRAGLFELLPMIGPVLGAVPAVLIALTHGFPLVLWVIVLFLLIQQVESTVIGPKITGHAVGLHPLGAMLALLAGVQLGGLLGALFAVPATGILYVLAVAVYGQWQGRSVPAAAPRSGLQVAGLARGLSRRRPGGAPLLPLTPAGVGSGAGDLAATIATTGGDTAPRPATLIALDQEADELRERFEQAESARQGEEAADVQATYDAERRP